MTNSKKLNNSSEIGIKHRYIDAESFHKIVDELGDEFLNLSYITYGDERIAYESKVDVLDTVLAKLDEQPTADVIELDKVKQIIKDSMNDDNWHNGILVGLFRKICGEENHD